MFQTLFLIGCFVFLILLHISDVPCGRAYFHVYYIMFKAYLCILWSNSPYFDYIQHLSLSVICCSLSFLCFSEFVNDDELTIKLVAVSTSLFPVIIHYVL